MGKFEENSFEKVSVMLYGGKSIFGGKEKPLSADIIYCKAKEACPLYQKKKCICCRNAFDISNCPYGKTETIRGYTSRAKKYSQFRSTYKDDPLYGALDRPQNVHFRLIGDWCLISLPGLRVDYFDEKPEKLDDIYHRFTGVRKNILYDDPFGFSSSCWIPVSDVDAQTFADLLGFRPRAFLGGEITSYKEKIVPAFMHELEEHWPEMYEQVCELDPKLGELKIDWKGRKAKALTLKQGIELHKGSNVFVLEGDALVCPDYTDILVRVNGVEARHAFVSIPLTEESAIEVEDNDWVVPGQTEFVDG